MNRFKIKSLKAFSLIELLVSIVVIAAITMLISSAFIGMMAQKRNLQVKETAEDMTREIISAVTRNSDNLDLLLYYIKTKTSPSTSGIQFNENIYCPEIVGNCTAKKLGWPIDLTTLLKLDGIADDATNKTKYKTLYSTGLVILPVADFTAGHPPTDLLIDRNDGGTPVWNRHPKDSIFNATSVALLPSISENDQKFRFFKKNPSTTVVNSIPVSERYRNGIFSFIDIESLNMKMKLLPPNTGSSINTKVFLYVGVDSPDGNLVAGSPYDLYASNFSEPDNATDYADKGLIITAVVKYSTRGTGGITESSTEGSQIILTKEFHPTMVQGDAVCMTTQTNKKPASCPECRTNRFAPGCDPCNTYANGSTTRATAPIPIIPTPTSAPYTYPCP